MGEIPEGVKQFLATHIDNIDSLRILLLLQNAPDRDWTLDAICAELRIPPDSVSSQTGLLISRGLLSQVPGTVPMYRYCLASPELDALVKEIDKLDRQRPVTLINLIYSVKPSPAQAFADAFKLNRG